MSKDRKQTLLILGGIQARFQDLRKPLKVHSHFASVLEISGDFNELVYFKQIDFQKVQFHLELLELTVELELSAAVIVGAGTTR